jgi:hypothetical protein
MSETSDSISKVGLTRGKGIMRITTITLGLAGLLFTGAFGLSLAQSVQPVPWNPCAQIRVPFDYVDRRATRCARSAWLPQPRPTRRPRRRVRRDRDVPQGFAEQAVARSMTATRRAMLRRNASMTDAFAPLTHGASTECVTARGVPLRHDPERFHVERSCNVRRSNLMPSLLQSTRIKRLI